MRLITRLSDLEWLKDVIAETGKPMSTGSDMADVETQLHLIIKDLRSTSSSDIGVPMMVCSSEDRAQIVHALIAAGYGLVADAKREAWEEADQKEMSTGARIRQLLDETRTDQ